MRWLVLAALLLRTAALDAQACTGDRTLVVRAFADDVRYEAAGGTDGTALGAGVAWSPGALRLAVDAASVSIDRAGATPVVGRAEVAFPSIRLGGAAICASVLAGASRVSAGGERATALAAGPAVNVSRSASLGSSDVTPYVQLRGLVGTVTGEILGESLSATELALGVEWGVEAGRDAVAVRASVALDGFGRGVGIAPFPARAYRLAIRYRF